MVEVRLTGQVCDARQLRRWLDDDAHGITSLSLWDAALDDDAVAALAAHPAIGSLRALDLSWNLIGPAGARALAQGLPALESLRLYHNDLGEAGAAAVAEAPWALRSLNLCGNGIGEGGVARLAASGGLRDLRSLHLGCVGLGDAGARALLEGQWPQLEELNVRDNDIGDAAPELLDGSLPALRQLGLDDNPIDDDELRAITRSAGWPRLRWINLGGTALGPDATEILCCAPASSLAELRVQTTTVDPARVAERMPGCAIIH